MVKPSRHWKHLPLRALRVLHDEGSTTFARRSVAALHELMFPPTYDRWLSKYDTLTPGSTIQLFLGEHIDVEYVVDDQQFGLVHGFVSSCSPLCQLLSDNHIVMTVPRMFAQQHQPRPIPDCFDQSQKP